ncbi:MAG: glycosyltransferase [Bryobacteraceae bacterium]
MLRRKFAVIKLWPNLKTAEDECIARLKIAAKSLGLQCIEVDSFARMVYPPRTQLTREDVDFVLSLHFETPKRYDIFSFAALWNPLQFFHEWGYRRYSRNLLTHDDFLSCASPWADDHVRRFISNDPMREGPQLRLYHSLSEPILTPTTGEQKLFYAGINWERLGKRPPRHQELLKLLDESGDLRIYGPRSFQGVNVWDGYKSYSGSIPFDGVSIVRLINKAGISLALSSEAHQQSELMSNRLFESLAGGAVIISDENPFSRRFFGDTLLYVNTSLAPEETYQQVQSHLDWIRSEPDKARELARAAQEIFRKEFALDRCLGKVYEQLPARKQKLTDLYRPTKPEERIAVIFLMPEFDMPALEQHIASWKAQEGVNTRAILAMDSADLELFGDRVRTRLSQLEVPMTVEPIEFHGRYPTGSIAFRRRIGYVINQIIERMLSEDYFCIVGPHEQLFSDHLCSLLRTLQDHQDAGCAWSDMLLKHKTADGSLHADLADEPDIYSYNNNRPIGFGRLLFRKTALRRDLHTALLYLDALAMDLLHGITNSVPTRRCTLAIDIQSPFNTQFAGVQTTQEHEILIDYAPDVFRKTGARSADHLEPVSLSLDRMNEAGKTKIAVELAHSVPVPGILKKIGFGLYRRWYRSAPK